MNLETFLTIRHLQQSPAEAIKGLESASTNDLYRAALVLQNELHIGATLDYLGSRPKWFEAKTVLDLGCGPGDLIAHLSRRFPDKSYTGVDMNESFVAIAGEQAPDHDHCRFVHADLYEFAGGRYEFAILRAVLQHLKDPDRLMTRLPHVLSEDGAVLFLDTTRENFVDANPPIAAFNDFYDQLEAVQKDHTGSRDCIAELERQLPRDGFRLVESLAPLIAVSGAADREKAIQYLILGCVVAASMMSVALDVNTLIADLLGWHNAAHGRLGLKSRLLMIERG